MSKKKNITGIVTCLVAIVTGMIVIIFPLVFFFHSYQNTAAMLETEAEINAGVLTNIISASGDYWEFEEIRLTEYLQNRPQEGVLESRRIVNNKNEIVAESVDNLQTPLIMRFAELMDSGVVVGRIEISRSLRPLWRRSGILFLLMLPVGLGIFFILRILPIRSLLRAEAELCKLNEELEARVAERTLQLEAQITERINAEKNLSASEEKYRNFLESSPIGICITDLSGHVQFINRRIEEASGWKREDLLSQSALEMGFFDEETKQVLLARLAARLNGDAPRITEIPVICKDGSRLWIDLKTTILYKDGLPSALQLAFIDITDRRKAEEALRESEKKYRLLIENSSDLFYTISFGGYFIYVNPVAERIMGCPLSEIVGKHFLSFVRPDFHKKIIAFYKKQYDERIPSTYFEYPIITGDGRSSWIGQNIQFRSVNGKLIGFQAVARDITERKQAEEALRENEKKYRFLTDKMLDVVWMTDLNLRTVYVSPSIKAALGFTPEERMAQDISEQVTPATLAVVLDLMAKQYEMEQQGQADPERTVTYEAEYYHKDGSIRWCENIASGVRNDEGVAIGLHGVSRDITKRKEMEKALQESEKKYRELVNFLPVSLFEMDLEGNITSGNPAIFETFGYKQSDIEKGLNAFRMIVSDDLDRLRANIRKLLLWERKEPTEYTGIRKDGSNFPFMIFSSVIISNGNPVGLRGAIIDLTKQKQAEALLQKSEKKYRELVDFLPIAIYEMDLEGNIISGNPEIFKMFGYTQNDLEKGLNALQSLISPQDHDRAGEIALRILSGERTGGTEYTGVRKGGSTFPFLNVASPIISENKPVGLRGVIIDLTKQKQTEEDLQNARDLLLQSEKLAAIGRLSAGVAHEILNPVNIISLELQILQTMESLPTTVLEELKVCMDQINRIVTITDNLKEFSRIPKRRMEQARISNVIDYVVNLCATQLKIEGIETEISCEPGLPEIFMDKEKMEQVIMNLISNAMYFMEGKEKKILRITAEEEILIGKNNQLKIVVADTGTGIKIENMSKIFDPFFTTKEMGKGTGLGLSISYGIIHDHGGVIWAENNVWGGASFYIMLPVKAEMNEKNAVG